MGNTFKTVFLLGTLTGLLVVFGNYFGGTQGMMIAFLFALVMNFGAYWFSDKIVLAMYKARPVTEAEAPELVSLVRSLSQRAHLPMPKVWIVPSPAPNAFATGRNPQHAAVAVTEGLLQIMNRDQLEGVLAHELGHVTNRDTLISAVAATLAGVIMMLANMARWAAFFGGGRDDEDRGGGIL
ncbi:MAG TPA: M48 family metalloprotease, partial [Candidatus Methylomirabilis sp.]|nr:M48 family metalloprotease [Candidatus Methylomirabilis sp.]